MVFVVRGHDPDMETESSKRPCFFFVVTVSMLLPRSVRVVSKKGQLESAVNDVKIGDNIVHT